VLHNLGHDFDVHGIEKPGANTKSVVNTSTKLTGKLTKKDTVVVWGGTQDIGRNETEKGLQHIKKFVKNHYQANVIVMSVPCRYDLEPKLCVNDEVKVYNRKLKKHLKVFGNTCVIEVDSNRDLFTRHGLNMKKGKEQLAKKRVKTIQVMLNEKKSDPIMMKHKEDRGVDKEGTKAETTTVEIESNQKNLKKDMQSNNESEDKQTGTLILDISGTRSSVRQKKAPKSKSNDFLW
jgi:RNase H-fold protein (predicted Holliday junction resolvase)